MSKISIIANLKGIEKEHCIRTKGILKDDKIVYYEDQLKVSITLFPKVNLVRETSDLLIELTFSQDEEFPVTNGKCYVKSLNQTIPLKIKTQKLSNQKGMLEIIYLLEVSDEPWEENHFLLEYEVEE